MITSIERQTMKKVYLRLLPFCFVLYFICYLDRVPPHILEDPAFRMRPSQGEVECELEAEDFAGAVAEAIRTLEVDFVHVLGIERLL